MDSYPFESEWVVWSIEALQGLGKQEAYQLKFAVLKFLAERESSDPITPEEVAIFFGSGLGRRADSKRWYIEGLQSFLGWAVKKGTIEANPMDSALVQVILTAPARRRRPSSGVRKAKRGGP